jgi:hypothetical protein
MNGIGVTKSKNFLVVCRSPEEIHLLGLIRQQPDCRYLVGADYLRSRNWPQGRRALEPRELWGWGHFLP